MTPEVKERIEQIRHGIVPEGYKKSDAGIIPDTWVSFSLGDLGDAKNGLNFHRDDSGYILRVLGVGDFKDRSVLTGTSSLTQISLAAKPEQEYMLQDGDIVFVRSNGSKELVGRNLLVYPGKNLVSYSGFCIRYRIQDNTITTPEYLNFILDGGALKKKLRRENQGSNISNLNQDILCQLKLAFPDNKDEQGRILQLLLLQDSIIELKEKLLAEKQKQKKQLMQQLLTGKRRLPGFADKWTTVELGDLFDYIQPSPYLVKSTDYSDLYKTPVLTAGKTFVLGYTNESEGIFDAVPVVVFDDFTTSSKYVDFPFKAKSSAMKILTIKEGYNIKFAYEAMQLIRFSVGGHERHWISKYSCLSIDVPTKAEQDAIANIITIADREISLIQESIAAEKQKKKVLMQLLLTGIVRT